MREVDIRDTKALKNSSPIIPCGSKAGHFNDGNLQLGSSTFFQSTSCGNAERNVYIIKLHAGIT